MSAKENKRNFPPPPQNLINWFIDLSLKDKIEAFNYINNRNLEKQNAYTKDIQDA